MISYFTRHPTAGNIVMLAIIAIGFVALGSLNRETFPEIKPSKVQVRAVYPGASAADVEDAICKSLENATDGISYLIEQSCDARDNMAIMTLEMSESGDMRAFLDDINAAVDGINDFPAQVEDPVITQLGRVSNVATIAITSTELTQVELKRLTEYYRDRLLSVANIPIVEIAGFSEHQLQIQVNPEASRKYRLSVSDIANLVGANALDLPAGDIQTDNASYQIRFENARKTADELEDLVILSTANGGEIRLGEIAKVVDRFENPEDVVLFNGEPAGLLVVSKNKTDDTLTVFSAIEDFIASENAVFPVGTHMDITEDAASIVRDRLSLLLKNGWQGLLLASLALFLFFSWRYTFWVAVGLPVSFLGGLAMMVVFNISINMISMVALLMAIGILMDDAIVLSESISHEYKRGKSAVDAAIDGTNRVKNGIFASFLTSACLFGSLLMMQGEMGQILGVIPVVLLSVLSVSLIEAFLILPRHLLHSLEHAGHKESPRWRQSFEAGFFRLQERVANIAKVAIQFRYVTVGTALAMLVLSIGLMATGAVKFKAFPDLEGNQVVARVLLSQGASLRDTEVAMKRITQGLQDSAEILSKNESAPLVENIQLRYGVHSDVPESGVHLASLNVSLLDTEQRNTSITELISLWREKVGQLPGVLSVQYAEPGLGPSGRAIEVRLSGNDLSQLSAVSWELQAWLNGYVGVSNIIDDLRPGMPQFVVNLKPGALSAGLNSKTIANELRAAYQGSGVGNIYLGDESYEIIALLEERKGGELRDLDNFALYSQSGDVIPLTSVATVHEKRDFSRIARINHKRTVTVFGDVDSALANTGEVIADIKSKLLPDLEKQFPGVKVQFKGEVESGGETSGSIVSGFILGGLGVFLLLSFIFGNFREPALVMLNIPLALIGAVWGHLIMGLDFSLPSMIGFVSLAGIVVNDSILLVIYVKRHVEEGEQFHDAATLAVRDRFRAIFLTSITTVAGMTPLLFETSTQALILVPLVTSVVFGMLSSTLLILLVLPSIYAILEDFGAIEAIMPQENKLSAPGAH